MLQQPPPPCNVAAAAAVAGVSAALAAVARRVFDRGVFVRFPVGFCHRIQLRAIVSLSLSSTLLLLANRLLENTSSQVEERKSTIFVHNFHMMDG